MDLTEQDIKEFQKLYKDKFYKDLDYPTARHKLTMLVMQVKTVYQPITKKQLEELARRDAMKEDAEALAQLIYDIYQDKKRGQTPPK
jgi:hypothetical protein